MSISRERFGMYLGREVTVYTLDNGQIKARIMDLGGTLIELHVPDAAGHAVDVVLGFDRLESYLDRHFYFGAVAGRCANRIADGSFELDGKTWQLARNEADRHHLHGGVNGFNKYLFQADCRESDGKDHLILERVSPHMEEGYPGELRVRVTYSLGPHNDLTLAFHAETDRPTIVNLAGHSYFNLAGHDSGPITDHELTIKADAVTPTTPDLIPTGEILPVENTPYDFRQPRPVGRAMADTPEGTFDINYVLDKEKDRLEPAAKLKDPASGRVMTLSTTAPGLQFYTGQHILENTAGKNGRHYNPFSGLCLETQVFPNAVNTPAFPSAVLRPGEVYEHVVVHAFGSE